MKFLKSINILTLIFISIIISQYNYGNFKYLYDIITILVLFYLYLIKNRKYRVIIKSSNFAYIIYFLFTIIICTFLRISDKSAILLTARIIILLLICYGVLSVYGEEYIINFNIDITKIMFILNLISIFEYINNTNFYYKYLDPNSEVARWFLTAGNKGFRISSVFLHPIVYGNILVINLVILLVLKKKLKKKFFYISFVLILINLFGTQSRSSWISFIILVIAFLGINILNKKVVKKNEVIKIYVIILVVIINIALFDNFIIQFIQKVVVRFSFDDGSNISKLQRLGTIENITNYMVNNIHNIFIGNGINSIKEFMLSNPVQLVNFASADNQYVTFTYDLGGVFTIIYCLYIIKAVYYAFVNRDIKNLLSVGILGAISVNMFFYEAFYFKVPTLFFIIAFVFNCTSILKLSNKENYI